MLHAADQGADNSAQGPVAKRWYGRTQPVALHVCTDRGTMPPASVKRRWFDNNRPAPPRGAKAHLRAIPGGCNAANNRSIAAICICRRPSHGKVFHALPANDNATSMSIALTQAGKYNLRWQTWAVMLAVTSAQRDASPLAYASPHHHTTCRFAMPSALHAKGGGLGKPTHHCSHTHNPKSTSVSADVARAIRSHDRVREQCPTLHSRRTVRARGLLT